MASNIKVAVCAIIKNEGAYIKEWVIHYLSIGVSHIVLYDNGSTDDTFAQIDKFINHGYVTLIRLAKPNAQVEAYNHCLSVFSHHFDWIGYFDADELLVLKQDASVIDYLSRAPENVSQVKIPWRVFGFSGHKVKPHGRVAANYKYAEPKGRPIQCKSFVRPLKMSKFYCHVGALAEGISSDADFNPSDNAVSEQKPTFLTAQVNHYYTKSEAEFTARVMRGTADGTVKSFQTIESDRYYSELDDSYAQFCEKKYLETERKMAEFSENPVFFGHGFALPYDIHNYTLYDFEKALSNYLHGVESPINTFKPLQRHTWANGGIFSTDNKMVDMGGFASSNHFDQLLKKCFLSVHSWQAVEPAASVSSRFFLSRHSRIYYIGRYRVTGDQAVPSLIINLQCQGKKSSFNFKDVQPGEYLFAFNVMGQYFHGAGEELSISFSAGVADTAIMLIQP